MGGELLGGGVEGLVGHGVERVEDEQGRGVSSLQLGAAGLAPVPAPAGHAGVVAPHHLAGVGVLDDRDAVAAVSKGSAPVARTVAANRRTGEVLPADRELVQHRDRVVGGR